MIGFSKKQKNCANNAGVRLLLLIFGLLTVSGLVIITPPVSGFYAQWYNGDDLSSGEPIWDFSTNPNQPTYGTHDWIATQARLWLPAEERGWLDQNQAAFLLGTEAPDNKYLRKISVFQGYGDFDKQKITFTADHSTTTLPNGDALAKRVQEEAFKTVVSLHKGQTKQAAFYAGAALGYLGDASAYPHTMGGIAGAWNLEQHHSDYELSINEDIVGTGEPLLNSYLAFDDALVKQSPYTLAYELGKLTSQGAGLIKSAGWMDENIPTLTEEKFGIPYFKLADINATYRDSIGHTLNAATNASADLLHTLATSGRLYSDGILVRNSLGQYAVVKADKISGIPNPETLRSHHFKYSVLISQREYSNYEKLSALPIRPGTLVRREGSFEIGLVEGDNKYHPFCSGLALINNGYLNKPVQTISIKAYNRLTRSSAICTRIRHWEGELIKGDGPAVGRISGANTINYFPSLAVLYSWGYNWSNVIKVSESEFKSYTPAPKISFRDGTLLKNRDLATVYLMEQGKKRSFSSGTVFTGLSYSWDIINLVSITTLNQIPNGPRIDFSQIR